MQFMPGPFQRYHLLHLSLLPVAASALAPLVMEHIAHLGHCHSLGRDIHLLLHSLNLKLH